MKPLMRSPFAVLEPHMMPVRIRRPDGETYTQEYAANDLDPITAMVAARKDCAEWGEKMGRAPNTVVAVSLGEWGWVTAEELDAEAAELAREADAKVGVK